ncbi:MAG: dTDP-glucose 4,6-dehydratase [bacterium]|nr:dTDP-glucose 4,6-dehydratase [bacterium]
MAGMLVTGGAGFIGANFVRYVLAQDPCDVVVLDKLTYAGNRESLADVADDKRLRFVEGDIADAELVGRLFAEHRFDAVVNFAAESHVDRSIDSPRPFVDTNIVGAFVLLDAARAHVAQAPATEAQGFRFLHVSTDEVYGSLGDDGLFTEETPYAPNSPYAASKASADHLVRAYHKTYGLPALITNCSNNYGPYQYPEKLIPLMILNTTEAKPLPIYGDGLNVRDWLYVEDHCGGILKVLRDGPAGRGFNIGGNAEKTNVEVVDAICDAVEQHLPAASNPAMQAASLTNYRELKTYVEDRKGHDRRYAIDARRIREELGWKPRHGFEVGLTTTVRWYLDNRDWCEAVQHSGAYRRERLGTKERPAQ